MVTPCPASAPRSGGAPDPDAAAAQVGAFAVAAVNAARGAALDVGLVAEARLLLQHGATATAIPVLETCVAMAPDVSAFSTALEALRAQARVHAGEPAVDVSCTSGHDPAMPASSTSPKTAPPSAPPPPPPPSAPARRAPSAKKQALIWELAAMGKDAELLQLAEEAAGSQKALSALCGVAVETLSRAKNGHRKQGLSTAVRTWVAKFAANPAEPPPPLPPGQIGQRPRAGAQAPSVAISVAARRSFNALADRHGQRAVFEWCMRAFLLDLGDGPLPQVGEPLTARSQLRCYRVDAELLSTFEARCGGAEYRRDYLRAAIEAGVAKLSKVPASDGLPVLASPPAVAPLPAAPRASSRKARKAAAAA